MQLLKYFLLIIFSINLLYAGETRTALVNVIDAAVYSDPLLKNPIGIAPRGDHIAIGLPLEKNHSVVPVIVAGRVAYMKITDLYIDMSEPLYINGEKHKAVFHDPNAFDPAVEEDMKINNTANFSIHLFNSGSDMQEMFNNIDGVQQSYMTELSASYIHHSTNNHLLWGAGFDYYSISSPSVDFNFIFLKGILGYTFLKEKLYSLDGFISYGFSLDSTFKNRSNIDHPPKGGFLLGHDIGIKAIFLPHKRFRPTASFSYTSLRLLYPDDYFDSQNVKYLGMEQLHGINLAIGIAIEI